MQISSTAFIILAASIGVALCIMIGAWVWMRLKTKKIKKEYQEQNLSKIKDQKPRENYGKLLWELKTKSENPLDDYQMEFILNSTWLNKYQTFKSINFDSDYEKRSLIELMSIKEEKAKPDLLLINGQKDFNPIFDQHYQQMKTNQMIIIANANRKEKTIKEFMAYLKMIGAKYEWQNYGKGIILVVK